VIEEFLDSLSSGELVALVLALDGRLAPSGAGLGLAGSELGVAVGDRFGGRGLGRRHGIAV
jgi:hypothetical protein